MRIQRQTQLLLFFIATLFVFSTGCKKDKPTNHQVPELTTKATTFLNPTNVCTGGIITKEGSSAVTGRGVCWSEHSNPTLNDSCTSDGLGAGSFFSYITGLAPLTTYYIRAYATNSEGTGYGDQVTISTPDFTNCGTVTDIDGNVYQTIVIGSQCWMKENLKTTRFNDGTPIPLVTDPVLWNNYPTPAFCYYDNDEAAYKNLYGALYKGYTHDTGDVCPAGWHVPTEIEWTTLINFLQGETIAGGKLKAPGTQYWAAPNKGATNESGFTGLPGGGRMLNAFSGIKEYAFFACVGNLSAFSITKGSTNVHSNAGKYKGVSVRCIKD
jgi:uncharacterized protein (TIGR02145 family)